MTQDVVIRNWNWVHLTKSFCFLPQRRDVLSDFLCLCLRGPEDTCFEGGVFPAVLSFPSDYPLSPPKMRFTCDMFHPNSKSPTGSAPDGGFRCSERRDTNSLCLDPVIGPVRTRLVSLLSLTPRLVGRSHDVMAQFWLEDSVLSSDPSSCSPPSSSSS